VNLTFPQGLERKKSEAESEISFPPSVPERKFKCNAFLTRGARRGLVPLVREGVRRPCVENSKGLGMGRGEVAGGGKCGGMTGGVG
jgi:hypothetical protein